MTKLEQHLHEVNSHLPEGLKLSPPIGKKAMRYARSCLAYTYQSESHSSEGARILGPLNAILDKIEEIVAREKEAKDTATTDPSKTTPPKTSTPPPKTSTTPPKTSTPPPNSTTPPSEPRARWRDPDPNETPAEKAFREALEAVEKANAQKTVNAEALQAQQAREALEVVDRYLHGEQAGAASASTPEGKMIQELRRALLLSFQRRSGRTG